MLKTGVYLIFLMLLAIPVMATYSNIGGTSQIFNVDSGNFNSVLATATTTGTRTIGNGTVPPVIDDLNNDGINEIVVFDDGNIRVYNNNTLGIIDSYAVVSNPTPHETPIQLFDIDGSGDKEIIIIASKIINHLDVYIVDFNGTHLSNQTSFPLITASNQFTNGEAMFYCPETDLCGFVFTRHGTPQVNTPLYVGTFDSTSLVNNPAIAFSVANSGLICLPKIRSMAYGDYDDDTVSEFVYTFWNSDNIVNDYYRIIWYNPTTHTNEKTEGEVALDFITGLSDCKPYQNWLSSPLLYDIDGSSSNGLETVVAFMDSSTEFEMRAYKGVGSGEIAGSPYPQIFQADGELISNVFLANAFTDTGKVDFCVAGYDNTEYILDILCASELTGQTPQTREFLYDTTDLWQTDFGMDFDNIIAHATSTSQAQETQSGDSQNLDEIVNTFGIWSIDYDNNIRPLEPLTKTLVLEFENPKGDAMVIMSDYEGIGLADMIALSKTNLFYIDDGFTNSDGEITEITVNPCIDAVWKVNTTVQVSVKVSDLDADTTRSRVTLYDSHPNEQLSNWSAFVAVNTTITHAFIANQTIAVGTLTVDGTDSENPTNIDTETLTFSVASNGVEFGDCESTFSFAPSVEAEAETGDGTSEADVDDNAITNGIDAIPTGNLGYTIIWLIIMVTVMVGIFWQSPDRKGATIALIAELMLLIVGVKLGFIGVGILVAMIVIGLVAIGLFVGKLFTGANGSL